MANMPEGSLLWEGSEVFKHNTNLYRYMQWLKETRGLTFSSYEELWRWSVSDLDAFWTSIWDFFDIKASKPYTRVLASRSMPGAQWFPGAELNYAEHALRHDSNEQPAILFQSEVRPFESVSWKQLKEHVASVAAALRNMGVQHGDRVVAYLPNMPEAVIAMLASASIGAVWSSCSPDFGSVSVIDRFRQIEPKVLFAIDGYRYSGKAFDRRPAIQELQQALPTLSHTVLVPYLNPESGVEGLANALLWQDILGQSSTLQFEQVPFDHPLWVLYSSGTTGLPKAIVQGHGGILLEHLKSIGLHLNLTPDDRFFWFTTTGWMMWNVVVSGLLAGSTILLYDGSPGYPDLNVLWEFAEKTGMTVFGTSAGYLTSCMKAGIEPGRDYDLSRLVSMGSTGSPLPPEGFEWVYEHVKKDLWLASTSGGTDVCSSFVTGCPILPVYSGEIQCRSLGVKVEAFDPDGRPVIDEVGELVITEPMPSMPLYFWNDPDNARYRDSYFDMYPGVWRHGDWIKITPRGTAIIYGRSDSTINRLGVRMGTSEIYRTVESLPEVMDSLVIDLEGMEGSSFMPLFVVLQEGIELDDGLKKKIRDQIRKNLSPRHVPDEIYQIREVPRTLNGKKLEVPIKKILLGTPVHKAVNLDSTANPDAVNFFVQLAEQLKAKQNS
ncbi:Acetoacetyl-coenzyme A synthetase [Kyrpidia spormannii]|uniref:Acetoacetyl-coenzyme A synthetase n=3 Tax=Kyrpidia spormannii TaxID=2055160 RepID=A0ACA8ZBH5_9BACL|nr:Acetoacetyl-coenzyme A synthetase [Kyrpidia spormannii]CAB3394364.1 Acetoacetyl-coenzyme A synthetase [Kyrpidia spormannii]